MSRETKEYKHSLFGSLGLGMKSIVSGSMKLYYILEHKIGSKYHYAGELQEIIIDRAEIGRDPACIVRFDEVFETVSRRHAAIIKEDSKLKLIPLSETNPTLLNGKKMQHALFLQHGDEIQCAINGPKLVVKIPDEKNAAISSISLNRRFYLLGKQAINPYKKTLIVWICIVLLLILIGGFFFFNQ